MNDESPSPGAPGGQPTPTPGPPPVPPPPAPTVPPVYAVPPASRPPARPAKARSGKGWMVTAIILALLLGLSVLVHLSGIFAAVAGAAGGGAMTAGPHLHEILMENNRADHKIAVVPVEGIIMSGGSDYGSGDLVRLIEAQLKMAAKDDRVKAVVLKVNSPGGEVLASDDIYRLIAKFQQKHNKPVIASMGSLAASGGYYVSAPCRWIVANDMTITGSIGVIMQTLNLRGLMNKVGVRPLVYKSGRFKDMLSFSKDLDQMTPQEKADFAEEERMMKKMIDETFDRFKTVVSEGRQQANSQNAATAEAGRKLSDRWTEFADGRVLSGKDAYELGFVDELGNWEVALKRARALAGIASANVVTYQQPFDLSNFFRLLGKSDAKTLRIDLGAELPRLPPGLYYLAEAFLR